MKTKLILFFILIIHAFILTKLIFFPYPEFFIYPYLTNHGLKPYSQILDQHFPGLMFLPINFDNLGMTTPEIARIWLIGVVLLSQILLFLVSKEIFQNEKKALLVNFLYLIWQPYFEGYTFWIDSILPIFLLMAFLFILKYFQKKKGQYIFLVGLFLGIGVIFKQLLIPTSGLFLLYLIWHDRKTKTLIFFLLGFLPPIILMMMYFFIIGVFKDFWYWTITFNLTTFAQMGRKYPTLTQILRVGFLLAACCSLIFSKNKKILIMLMLFILGGLAEVYARFDFIHFQISLPFVLIAIVFGFTEIKKQIKKEILLGIIFLYCLITIWWQLVFYKGHISNQIFFYDINVLKTASIIRQNTRPGEKIFIFGAIPHLYQITNTLPPGNIFIFQFPWFMKEAEAQILAGLQKEKPNIVISDRDFEIEGQKITDFASLLDKYIQENYQEFDSVGSTKILRKKPQI